MPGANKRKQAMASFQKDAVDLVVRKTEEMKFMSSQKDGLRVETIKSVFRMHEIQYLGQGGPFGARAQADRIPVIEPWREFLNHFEKKGTYTLQRTTTPH